jgi:hypothetical protein
MTGGLAALCSSLASAANRIHYCLRGINRSMEWVFRKLRLLLETGGGSRRLDIQDLKRMGARLCLRRSLMLPRVRMSIVVGMAPEDHSDYLPRNAVKEHYDPVPHAI